MNKMFLKISMFILVSGSYSLAMQHDDDVSQAQPQSVQPTYVSFQSETGQKNISTQYMWQKNVLKGNQLGLTGEIPSSISDCRDLEEIHLNWNSLSGAVPTSLWDLRDLTLLNLEFNQLTTFDGRGISQELGQQMFVCLGCNPIQEFHTNPDTQIRLMVPQYPHHSLSIDGMCFNQMGDLRRLHDMLQPNVMAFSDNGCPIDMRITFSWSPLQGVDTPISVFLQETFVLTQQTIIIKERSQHGEPCNIRVEEGMAEGYDPQHFVDALLSVRDGTFNPVPLKSAKQ